MDRNLVSAGSFQMPVSILKLAGRRFARLGGGWAAMLIAVAATSIGSALGVSPALAADQHVALAGSGSQVIGDGLRPITILTASDAVGRLGFGGVAVSGRLLAASVDNPYPFTRQSAVYLFVASAQGWSHGYSVAKLTVSNGDLLSGVAISGNTVFVDGYRESSTTSGAVYVFTQPAGGWSGTIHESATLTAADSAVGMGAFVAASGTTVVSNGTDGAAYVYKEPPGGWSGTVHESAKLIAPGATGLLDIAVSGPTVVAGQGDSGNAAYVYTEPRRGWSGTLHQTATLLAADSSGALGYSVATSGHTVVAGAEFFPAGASSAGEAVYVFHEPSVGWSGTLSARAVAKLPAAEDALGPTVAVAGRTVGAIGDEPSEHICPCARSVYAFGTPVASLSQPATLGPQAQLTSSGPAGGVALDQQTMAVAALDGVHVFAVIGRPSVSSASLTGLQLARPRLRFEVTAGTGASRIKSVSITLPNGIQFAPTPSTIARGLTISSRSKYSVKLSHGRLALTFKKLQSTLRVAAHSPALTESLGVRKRAAALASFNKHHRKKRTLRLGVVVQVTDPAGRSTPLAISITTT